MLISNVFELEGEQASMRCDIEKKENSIQAQTIVQLFLDVCIILSSMGGALWVRMDFQFGGIDTVFLQSLEKYAGINIVCTLLVFRGFRLYNSLWRYAGMIELKNIVYAVTGSAVPAGGRHACAACIYAAQLSGFVSAAVIFPDGI